MKKFNLRSKRFSDFKYRVLKAISLNLYLHKPKQALLVSTSKIHPRIQRYGKSDQNYGDIDMTEFSRLNVCYGGYDMKGLTCHVKGDKSHRVALSLSYTTL